MNIYSTGLLATAAVNLVLAVFTIRQIRSNSALELCLLLFALTLYCFGYAFELSSENLKDILFWLKVEYLGIAFLPALIMLFAIQYTGRGHLLKPWMLILLLLLSCTTLILQYSNFKGLFYKEFLLGRHGPFTLAEFTKGPWYWIHQIYINTMLLISTLFYFLAAVRSKGIKKSRAMLLLIASVIPWGTYVVYLTGNSPYHIDICPFSFSIVGILYTFGIFRYQLLDLFPIALEHVFNSLTNGVIILDARKRLVGFNEAAAKIIPVLKRELIGQSLSPEMHAYHSISNLINGPKSVETEIEIMHGNNRQHFNVSFLPVIKKGGNISGYTIILNEITRSKQKEQKHIEKEESLKQQNITKDKFMAIIAHDLRNPFHIMINLSEIILRQIESGDLQSVSRAAKVLHDTSKTTYNLLQNLLEWALIQNRGMRLNLQKIKMLDLVLDEMKEQKHILEQKNITIRQKIHNHLTVRADEHMVKTVVRNLISNAIKYSYPDGIVTISASASEGFVAVVVKDQGTGMTKEEQKLLFTMDSNFSKKGTTSEAGTGLGLALCMEFVQLHGGTIWVESQPGKGSSFYFTLPQRTE